MRHSETQTNLKELVGFLEESCPRSNLDSLIGLKCYATPPKGSDPKWHMDIEYGGKTVTVMRCHGEQIREDNMIVTLPGDKPQVYKVESTQQAYGHDSEGNYMFGISKCRIYEVDLEDPFGRPKSQNELFFL